MPIDLSIASINFLRPQYMPYSGAFFNLQIPYPPFIPLSPNRIAGSRIYSEHTAWTLQVSTFYLQSCQSPIHDYPSGFDVAMMYKYCCSEDGDIVVVVELMPEP